MCDCWVVGGEEGTSFDRLSLCKENGMEGDRRGEEGVVLLVTQEVSDGK